MPLATDSAIDAPVLHNTCVLKVGGSNVPDPLMNLLSSLEVEQVLGRPDLVTVRFHADATLQETDFPTAWHPGAELEVALPADRSHKTVFKGEITSIELESQRNLSAEFVIVACDKRHRLFRTGKTRTFADVNIGDIISTLAGDASLSISVPAQLSSVFPYVIQQHQSNGDFIDELIRPLGMVMTGDVGTFKVQSLAKMPTTVARVLEVGKTVLSFSCTRTSDGELNQVEIRDWDMKTKAEIVATAPRSGSTGDPNYSAPVDFGQWKIKGFGHRVLSQSDAQKLAAGIAAEQLDGQMRLRAVCSGDPELAAGKVVELKGAGTPFSGKYRLSTVRHHFDLERGYEVDLASHGTAEDTIPGMLHQAVLGGNATVAPVGRRTPVVMTGIVSNNKGDGGTKSMEGAGQVKVKLPLLHGDADIESGWLRLASAGAGNDRGWYSLPEVNDEVLCVFEDGDLEHGYVIGGVYNGSDKSPRPTSKAVASDGKVNQRLFRSRTGHEVVFDDSSETPSVIIKTGAKKLSITLDDKNDKIVIDSDGDVEIKSVKKMSLEATDDLSIKGKNVTIEGQMNVDVKGGTKATLKATQVEVDGSGTAKVHGAQLQLAGDAMAELKAGLVKIN
jgi:uncharacterized protein involved in type VI secretion and phage assembly